MSSWRSPQYSEHRIGNSPALVATNSMVIGASPGFARGTAFFTLNALISTPCGPSADRTTRRTRSPSLTSITAGSKSNRRAMISNTLGSPSAGAGCCHGSPVVDTTPTIKSARQIEVGGMNASRTSLLYGAIHMPASDNEASREDPVKTQVDSSVAIYRRRKWAYVIGKCRTLGQRCDRQARQRKSRNPTTTFRVLPSTSFGGVNEVSMAFCSL